MFNFFEDSNNFRLGLIHTGVLIVYLSGLGLRLLNRVATVLQAGNYPVVHFIRPIRQIHRAHARILLGQACIRTHTRRTKSLNGIVNDFQRGARCGHLDHGDLCPDLPEYFVRAARSMQQVPLTLGV